MAARSVQASGSVVMVRPHHFRPNPETHADNAFQTVAAAQPGEVEAAALAEFDAAAQRLSDAGVTVHVFDDRGRATPDSVFPNNWFSTHHGGRVALYPMYAPSRRLERRADVVELLKREYRVQEVIDYSGLEYDDLFLEGTGAMVFDHAERVAYVGSSARADAVILERFCTAFGYEPMVFPTADPAGRPIYHTNVLMSIGTEVALVCLDAISERRRRDEIERRLSESGHDVVALSWSQVADFAGNAIELTGRHRILVMSERAAGALRPDQLDRIEATAEVVPLALPTIELAGGSARCMIADLHLTRR
ncbi:MAG TPA: arginine deiminase-related protein [Propionicimonas sp.]|nr:arginine deiminase-related protein [Propionicimonas sp.]